MTFSAGRYPKPSYTVVHDGVPDDTSATNYYVRYRDYIKNVVSSEIYATWNENAIYANTLVIMSFTLNRVYTEWYRNRGYNFTITSSTAYDQKWMHGRNIYGNVDRIVDSFPSGQQGQVRAQLSMVLRTVVSQQLLPDKTGGVVPAYEIMQMNSAIRSLIRIKDSCHHLFSVIHKTSTLNRSKMILTFNSPFSHWEH